MPANVERARCAIDVIIDRMVRSEQLAAVPGQVECGWDHENLGSSDCLVCGAQV